MADEPVVEAEGKAPEGKPAWLPDRFETPEALAKGYEESQAEMNRLRAASEQERTQFAAALEAMQTPTPQAPSNNGFDPDVAAYNDAYERGDTAAMLRIQAQAAAKEVVPAVAQLIDARLGEMTPAIEAQQAHVRESSIRMAEDVVTRNLGPDVYQELLPTIRTLIADHPNYLPQSASVEGYAAAILDVAKLAQHDALIADNARLQAEITEKTNAQLLTGGGNRSVYTPDQQKAEFERIKNTPAGSFSEALRGA